MSEKIPQGFLPDSCRGRVTCSFLVLLLVVSGCGPTLNTVRETNDEDELFIIATKAKTPDVSKAAMMKLSQASLLKIATGQYATRARLLAVDALTDPDALVKVAISDYTWYAPRAAVARLKDQKLLGKVVRLARHYGEHSGGMAALRRLTDQSELAKVARFHEDAYFRLSALTRITDLIIRITDQKVLGGIVRSGCTKDIKFSALMRITDMEVLTDIATDGKHVSPSNREYARRKITDPRMLARIAESEAKRKIAERHGWERIASTAESDDLAVLALKSLSRTGTPWIKIDKEQRDAAAKLTDEQIKAIAADEVTVLAIRTASEKLLHGFLNSRISVQIDTPVGIVVTPEGEGGSVFSIMKSGIVSTGKHLRILPSKAHPVYLNFLPYGGRKQRHAYFEVKCKPSEAELRINVAGASRLVTELGFVSAEILSTGGKFRCGDKDVLFLRGSFVATGQQDTDIAIRDGSVVKVDGLSLTQVKGEWGRTGTWVSSDKLSTLLSGNAQKQ